MTRAVDITGRTFGRLRVVRRDQKANGRDPWACVCSCGVTKTIEGGSLRRGLTQSCGCLQRERTAAAHLEHGRSETREYRIWTGMVQRCTNPSASNFERYGGRGIRVAEEWVGPGGFERFFSSIGPSPSGTHSIERINNARGYEPGNVQWSTARDQARNTRRNRIVVYMGAARCVAEWSDILSLPRAVIYSRLDRGWSPERALSTPSGAGGR